MSGPRLYARWIALGCGVAGAVTLMIGVIRYSRELDVTARSFKLDSGPQATLLYDRAGEYLFSLHDEERTDRRLDELSPSVSAAVLAAEDRTFRTHNGINLKRMAAAAWRNLRAGRVMQGASTITQQLVRSQALGREREWSRKFREILLTMRIERRFTKDQILETYLNRIYFGDSYFGVEAAARGYFRKSASELTDAEAALLAGIIRCPSACSPRSHPEKARARRDVVLRAMRATGTLSAAAAETALAETPRIELQSVNALAFSAGEHASGLYFIDAVRQQLVDLFGEAAVLRGGLHVYTTIDVRMQKAAEDAINNRLRQLSAPGKPASRPRPKPSNNPVEGSLVAIDPRSGQVLALVGGHDFHATPFNRATQALRQPGSAFKPILFAAALEHGYAPSSVLDRLDVSSDAEDVGWVPNGEHEEDSYTLRQALVVSSNRASARLLQLMGVYSAQYYARLLGITSPLPSVPSLALGTGEVSLIDLTTAYGVFANNGRLVPHTLISRVDDELGVVLWEPSRRASQAIRPSTAFMMSTMLADVMNRGTGAAARSQGFKLPAGGKTGTTDRYADAWFVGYTPSLVTGVWFGRDQPAQIVSRGFAATVAVPAWAEFMKRATANDRAEWFQMPPDLEKVAVCQKSGLLATQACREEARGRVVEDYFPLGTAPREPCAMHTGEGSLLNMIAAIPARLPRATSTLSTISTMSPGAAVPTGTTGTTGTTSAADTTHPVDSASPFAQPGP